MNKQDALQSIRLARGLIFRQIPLTIGNYLEGYEINVSQDYKDPFPFLQEARPEIHRILEIEIRELGGIKFQLGLRISMRKDQIQGPPTYSDSTFYHEQIPLLNENEIDLHDPFDNLSKIIESWTNQGSGWVIERVEYLWLNIAKYQPLHGGSYIDLPAYLKNKKKRLSMSKIKMITVYVGP